MRKKKKKGLNVWQVLLIVLTIALIIITLGWFIKNYSNDNKPLDESPKKDDNKDATIIITIPVEEQLKNINKQLEDIQKRMDSIERIKEEIFTNERYFYIGSRALLGFFLIIANIIYLHYSRNWDIALDKQVDFNGAILLGYSFLAFVTYGTPTRLVSSMKKKTQYFVNKKIKEKDRHFNYLLLQKNKLTESIELLASVKENQLNSTL